MKKYVVYFEIFGKKLKTTVYAENEFQAENVVKSKIKFWKIVPEESSDIKKGFEDIFKEIYEVLNKKK